MDIVSVYLNLASLLGTEIEVEGYYERGALYNVRAERQSLRLFLPQYVDQEGVLTLKYALTGTNNWTPMTFRGRLSQNHQGEPLLYPISSARYSNTEKLIDYQARLTDDEATIECSMQADVSMTHEKFSIDEMLQNTGTASHSLSNNVLLKGSLIAPKQWEGNFSFQIGMCIAIPLVAQYFKLSDRQEAGVAASNRIWIQEKDTDRLNDFLGPIVPGGYSYWREKNLQLLAAGQLAYFDGHDKESNHPNIKHQLQFAHLYHVRISKTIRFKPSQDP